jgi:hypothetical protein
VLPLCGHKKLVDLLAAIGLVEGPLIGLKELFSVGQLGIAVVTCVGGGKVSSCFKN